MRPICLSALCLSMVTGAESAENRVSLCNAKTIIQSIQAVSRAKNQFETEEMHAERAKSEINEAGIQTVDLVCALVRISYDKSRDYLIEYDPEGQTIEINSMFPSPAASDVEDVLFSHNYVATNGFGVKVTVEEAYKAIYGIRLEPALFDFEYSIPMARELAERMWPDLYLAVQFNMKPPYLYEEYGEREPKFDSPVAEKIKTVRIVGEPMRILLLNMADGSELWSAAIR